MTVGSSIIANVCILPLHFRTGNKSAIQLLNESGYSGDPASLTVERIVQFLEANPALVEAWLSWSQDKRVSEGRYFIETQDGFLVGYYPNGERQLFSERKRACAEFVIREVASLHGRGL